MENGMQIVTAAEMGRELATQSEDNPAKVYLASLETATSRRTMRGALDKVAAMLAPGADLETFPWEQLRYQHVMAIRTAMAEELSYKTVNKRLSAVRRTMHECWRLGLIDAETDARIQDVGNLKGATLPAGRDVSLGELTALMQACANDQTAAGARDAALIGTMVCGPRRAEVVQLQLADVDLDAGFLTVHGKRNKERRVPLIPGVDAALQDWLAVRGDAPGALFYPIRRGGHIQDIEDGDTLSTQAVYAVLARRCEDAGIAPATPHDLRRTAVGLYLSAGVDIATVARIMGHASVTTTARYDRRPEQQKLDAARRLALPYRRRATLHEDQEAEQ